MSKPRIWQHKTYVSWNGNWWCEGCWWSMDGNGSTPQEAYEHWRLSRRYAICAWAYFIFYVSLIAIAVVCP
ncbi:MAG TPA: hypothetical protein VMQ17_10135 [Candidatus Sulfotelmatobacter sp.]|nr:hypothetical protein [Candidatus Sulfotelmatobacter sp.]